MNRLEHITAEARRINQARRTEVLKHDDLRKRLESEPLDFHDAEQWNGFIPPATVNAFSTDELCRVATMGHAGALSVRYNQVGHYGMGEQVNDSPRRAALLEISTEAWARRERVESEA